MPGWCNYEWDKETYDINADDPEAEILDHSHGDKLADVGFPATHTELTVLVRNDEVGRSWAYVDDSRMLPAEFSQPNEKGEYVSTGIKVPQRFHREIAAYACKKA